MSDSKDNLPVRFNPEEQNQKPAKGELIVGGKESDSKKKSEDSKGLNRGPLKGEVVNEPSGEVGPARRPPRQPRQIGTSQTQHIFQRILELIPYSHLALIPILVLLLIPAFSTIGRSFGSMMYPYQLDREEAFLVQQAMDLASAESIYTSIDEEPYLVGNYPPFYPAIVGGMTIIFSPSLPLGRFVVFFSVLLIAAGLMTINLRDTHALFPGFLAILLFMGTYDFADWVAYARVDITAIAFSVLGIAAVTSRVYRYPGLLIGCLFFVLAFFTKQTQLAAPAAAFLGLMFQGEKKLAWLLAAVVGGSIIGLVIFGNTLTDGNFFRHLVTYNKNEMVWSTLIGYGKHLWFFQKFLFITVGSVLVGAYFLNRFHPFSVNEIDLENHRPRSRALPIAVCYLIFTALSMLTAAKVGSALNYFLEFHVAVAILVSLSFGLMIHELQFHTAMEKRYIIPTIVVCLLLLLVHSLYLVVPRNNFSPVSLFKQSPDEYEELLYDSMMEAVSETKGPVLLEEPVFAILSGKEVIYQPFIMTQLAKEDKWDQSAFVERIENLEFNLIATTSRIESEPISMPGFTAEMQTAIFEGYDFHEQIGKYFLYIPKGTDRPIYGSILVNSKKSDLESILQVAKSN